MAKAETGWRGRFQLAPAAWPEVEAQPSRLCWDELRPMAVARMRSGDAWRPLLVGSEARAERGDWRPEQTDEAVERPVVRVQPLELGTAPKPGGDGIRFERSGHWEGCAGCECDFVCWCKPEHTPQACMANPLRRLRHG